MNNTFEDVIEALAPGPGVTVGTGFGQMPGLRVQDKIFSMLLHDELVVKLPRERCDWVALSREALEFVRPTG